MTSPELHLHQLDIVQQAGLFVRMTPEDYHSASFLDGRGFGPQTVGAWKPLAQVREVARNTPPPQSPLHFIFHMGHTGSTLLSRLLDESGTVQPLREPLSLRTLADLHDTRGAPWALLSGADIDALSEVLLRLWSRCGPGHDRAILKATSSAARIAKPLMAARPAARAVYLSMAAEPYLAVILGGPASLGDVRGHAEERMRRLARIIEDTPKALHAMSHGELVAASWATEALTRDRLREAVGDRVLAVDFDAFLGDVAGSMTSILAHLRFDSADTLAARIARSPALGRYAKAPEHGYSRQLREDVMRNSRRENSAEISRGLDWLESMAGNHSAIAKAVQQSG